MHVKKIMIFFIIGFFALFPIAKKFAGRLPPEFTVDHLAFDVPFDCKTNDLSLESDIFQYLGHGEQAIAFANQNSVIKFFLSKPIRGKKRFSSFSFGPFLHPKKWERKVKKKEIARKLRLMEVLKNYSVAFEKIKEKTGIIALHLTRKEDNLRPITLIDMNGKKHVVDLNSVSFVLQHKAILTSDKLDLLKNPEEKEKYIATLHQFIEDAAKEGFFDKEGIFFPANYGFIEDTPIYIDLGKVVYREKVLPMELQQSHDFLTNWAKKL